ncbi:MAG: hypothetical protein PHQ12_14380 [Chthoniobacteraceae bacterium]|nr:hypothetical protein [Chthoniobacteraceae bacterium]
MRAPKFIPLLLGLCAMALGGFSVAHAQSPYQSSADFAKYAQKLRENALLKMEPTVQVQTSGQSTGRSWFGLSGGRYPWKQNIVTTVFWIGEGTTARNPTPNRASSWDPNWMGNYGGVDSPDRRNGYLPVSFVPGQNPFYCALPYNDVTHGTTKPEASFVIPWFRQSFRQAGKSVCKGRWIAIRHGNRVCYAQWEDCGPFRTDHWQYVFGKEQPKANINGGAGLDVSPAVRDFLGMKATQDVCDWKFVDLSEIPAGPWTRYGENNDFVLNSRRDAERVASGKR